MIYSFIRVIISLVIVLKKIRIKHNKSKLKYDDTVRTETFEPRSGRNCCWEKIKILSAYSESNFIDTIKRIN